MLCQAVGTGQFPQQQPQHTHGRCGCGQQCSSHNCGSNSGGGYIRGGGGYNGGSSGNKNGGGYISGGGGNGGDYDGGNIGSPDPLPPLPVKWFKNWNYCFTHGGNMDNNHTGATCAPPGENHQRTATHTNIMGSTICGMNKTIFPSADGR
jgi:hypothetical protein